MYDVLQLMEEILHQLRYMKPVVNIWIFTSYQLVMLASPDFCCPSRPPPKPARPVSQSKTCPGKNYTVQVVQQKLKVVCQDVRRRGLRTNGKSGFVLWTCLFDFSMFHQQKYFWRSGAKGAGIILGKALIWAGQRCTGSHLNLLMFGNRSVLFGRWGYLQHRWVGPAFRNTHTQICHLRLSTVHCLKWLLSVCCGPSVFGRFAKVPTWTSQLCSVFSK